jgi:glycosyltransferase involved in cell wall biosynthesis
VTELLVSIVVPTFDRAGYVETAILSLLEQDYSALEVIVVDDGSQDETRAVLSRISERFPGERFRWISHPNQGQAASINRGFDAARG